MFTRKIPEIDLNQVKLDEIINILLQHISNKETVVLEADFQVGKSTILNALSKN